MSSNPKTKRRNFESKTAHKRFTNKKGNYLLQIIPKLFDQFIWGKRSLNRNRKKYSKTKLTDEQKAAKKKMKEEEKAAKEKSVEEEKKEGNDGNDEEVYGNIDGDSKKV